MTSMGVMRQGTILLVGKRVCVCLTVSIQPRHVINTRPGCVDKTSRARKQVVGSGSLGDDRDSNEDHNVSPNLKHKPCRRICMCLLPRAGAPEWVNVPGS